MKKLFLDDLRTVNMVFKNATETEFDVVRNFKEFTSYIQTHGLPDFISFDNDLGLDENGNVAKDGYAAAKWLVFESKLDLRNLEFHVHSANPVATDQIEGLLNNYLKHMRSNATTSDFKVHEINEEFLEICQKIEQVHTNEKEWASISDSPFLQSNSYHGFFDAHENIFRFK